MAANLSYTRLKHDEDEGYRLELCNHYTGILDKVIRRSRSRRRVHVSSGRRRLRVRIPGLRRFVRRKARAVKVAWRKVYERLKESRSHLGELFAGNYMFMQVTPTPLHYVNHDTNYKSCYKNYTNYAK